MNKVSAALYAGVAVCGALAAASASAEGSYAEDRAKIEDLQARYLFALDFRDAEAYAATFAEDGVLDYGAGKIKGRQAIREMVAGLRANAERQQAEDKSGLRRPPAGTTSRTSSSTSTATKRPARRIGSTWATRTRSAPRSSTRSATTRTSS